VTGTDYFGVFKYEVRADSPCVNIDFREFLTTDPVTGELSSGFNESQIDFNVAQAGSALATTAGCLVLSVLFFSFFRSIPAICFRYINCFLLISAAVGCGMMFNLFDIYWCGGKGEILDNDLGEYRTIRGRCFMEESSTHVAAALVLYLVTAIVIYVMSVPTVAMFEFTKEYELTSLNENLNLNNEEEPASLKEDERNSES